MLVAHDLKTPLLLRSRCGQIHRSSCRAKKQSTSDLSLPRRPRTQCERCIQCHIPCGFRSLGSALQKQCFFRSPNCNSHSQSPSSVADGNLVSFGSCCHIRAARAMTMASWRESAVHSSLQTHESMHRSIYSWPCICSYVHAHAHRQTCTRACARANRRTVNMHTDFRSCRNMPLCACVCAAYRTHAETHTHMRAFDVHTCISFAESECLCNYKQRYTCVKVVRFIHMQLHMFMYETGACVHVYTTVRVKYYATTRACVCVCVMWSFWSLLFCLVRVRT